MPESVGRKAPAAESSRKPPWLLSAPWHFTQWAVKIGRTSRSKSIVVGVAARATVDENSAAKNPRENVAAQIVVAGNRRRETLNQSRIPTAVNEFLCRRTALLAAAADDSE
jgi:hypothetical protein